MPDINDIADTVDAYLLLNAATKLFQKAPADLDAEQKGEAVALAEKEGELNQRILTSAQADGVEVSEASIAEAIAEIKKRYPENHEYLEDLIRNGLNEDTLRESLRRTLKVEKVLEKIAADVVVEDEEVAVFYQQHSEKFEQPELREARHILITINDDYPENTRAAVEKRVKEITSALASDKESFEALAMRHSECPTALEGGVLGKLPKGKLYEELDQVLFAMDEGQVSDAVESPVGIHILLCEKIHLQGKVSLDEATPKIYEHLRNQRAQKLQREWVRSLFNIVH